MAPTYIRTACNRDCPDNCTIIAAIDGDKVVRLQGDPDHPVTQGFLCRRTSRFLERQYSPDRLKTPLVRDGSSFREASWDQVLDKIAESMVRFRRESGGASILQYRCGGSLGMMKHVGDYFFERFGPVTIKSGDVCAGAAEAAQMTDFGVFDSNDLFDIENSKTIFLWGKNVCVSNVHLLPVLKRAKSRGARLVLIDPVHHRTAQMCDQFVQVCPGGDAALAMGMARWLFENGGSDKNAPEYCDHFEEYRQLVFSRSMDEWAGAADVTRTEIEQLAESYAESPAAILLGWGLGRRRYGAASVRAIDALGAISGNLSISGGGVSFYYARRDAFDLSFSNPQTAPRTIPEPLLGPGILAANDPPIRMAWIWAANPVPMLPESKTVAEALQTRELTVVVDPFLTDTARCADVVLPTTTMLEEGDLIGAYGHHWISESRPVISPPPGILTDYEIIQQLAQRVGLGEEFSADVETWKRRILRRTEPHGVTLESFAAGEVKNPFSRPVLFADRHFSTPSGRVNLLTELPDQLVENYAPTLRVAALSTEKAQSAQWHASEQQGPASARVSPQAAAGFQDGDLVTLTSASGSIDVVLEFDDRQRPDIVLMEKGGWLESGRCANSLVKAELTDDGECAIYYDTPVQISRSG